MKVNAPLRSFIWPALAAGAVVIAGGIAIYEHHQISVMQKQFAEEGPISEVAIRAQGRILVWLGAIEPLCEQTLTYYLSAKAKAQVPSLDFVHEERDVRTTAIVVAIDAFNVDETLGITFCRVDVLKAAA